MSSVTILGNYEDLPWEQASSGLVNDLRSVQAMINQLIVGNSLDTIGDAWSSVPYLPFVYGAPGSGVTVVTPFTSHLANYKVASNTLFYNVFSAVNTSSTSTIDIPIPTSSVAPLDVGMTGENVTMGYWKQAGASVGGVLSVIHLKNTNGKNVIRLQNHYGTTGFAGSFPNGQINFGFQITIPLQPST